MNLDLQVVNAALDQAPVQEVLRWAVRTFAGEIAVSSSFQTQSVPLLHIVATVVPQLPVLFLDTGLHFPETLAFRDRLVRVWKLNLVVVKAAMDCAIGGSPLWLADPELCCQLRKVAPMRQAMAGYQGWISGIRRDQTPNRATAEVVEAAPAGRFRIHPMAHWTQATIEHYMAAHDLPEHPLSGRGYPSIGCAPCTRPPLPAGDARSGRWAGSDKTECGLHTELRESA